MVEEIPAHKVILAMGSNVFDEMFFGPGAEPHNEIDVDTYTAEVFRIMVEYLYCDRASDLTEQNLVEVTKCAEQFHVSGLVDKCQILSRKISRRSRFPISSVLPNGAKAGSVEINGGDNGVQSDADSEAGHRNGRASSENEAELGKNIGIDKEVALEIDHESTHQTSQSTSRQSSVSEPASEEKKDDPAVDLKRRIHNEFTRQVQARMNVEGGSRTTSVSESSSADARTASKSKDAESKEDVAKAGRTKTISESKPSVSEVPSVRNDVDRGMGFGAKPEIRRKPVQVQNVRQVRPLENVNGETETEKVAGRPTYSRSALLGLENKYKQGNMMASDDLKNKVNAIIKKDGGGEGGPDAYTGLLSDVRALMNKISPNNYEKLSTRMLSMPFTKTGELLVGAVDVIFDKTLDNPKYANVHAKLCKKLYDLQAPVEEGQTDEKGNPAQPMKFRTVLLQRAQHYFEKTQREEEESDKDKQDTAVDPDFAEKKRVIANRRYVANIVFISELYNLDMLTDRVILGCCQKLLPQKPNFEDACETRLECLCKLLMSCARKIKPEFSKDVKGYFNQLQKMIDLKVTSSRIRFLMQDAIDLKNNNFVPRKLNASKGLKTKEEVRQEKLKEEAQSKAETMTAIHQLPPPMPQGRPPMGPDRSRLPPPHLQTVGMKSVRSVPGSMKNTQAGGGMAGRDGQPQSAVGTRTEASKPRKFLSMDRAGPGGAGGGMVTLSPQRWSAAIASLNPALGTSMGPFDNGMDNQNRSATSSRENSMSRGEHRGSLTNTPDMRAGSPQTEPSSNQGSPQVTPAQTPRMGSPMNIPTEERFVEQPTDQSPVPDEELEDFTKHLVASFLNADDIEMQDEMKSATKQLARLSAEQKVQFIVTVVGNLYIEAKKPDRPKHSALLLGLARGGSLPSETLANGHVP